MRKGATRSALAIGYLAGSVIEVFPFEGGLEGRRIENNLGPCASCPGWFSSDGKLIIWQFTWPDWEPSEPSLQVRTVKGEPVASWWGQLNTIYALSLSRDRTRIAIESRNYFPGAENTGLQYIILGTSRRVVLDAQPAENEANSSNSLGWSPVADQIVFSRNGQIVLLNIDSGERVVVAKGSNPAWSPDGRWISFTAADSHAMLLDVSTRRQVAVAGQKAPGTISWSPDSCCVSFSDQPNDSIASLARLIVYRVRDGQWFTLNYLSSGSNSTNFGWFYGYKELIEANRAREGGR
jgi:dipeptidyl aminopeptidase/acylaminoacyl peptidase